MTTADHHFAVRVGSQEVQVPVVPIADDLAIALLISVDYGVSFAERAGNDLARLLEPLDIEIVVSVATMGIPLAIEVTRALGLDDYVILHKTPKIHLSDALAEQLTSITTSGRQRLLFDRARVPAVEGRRVAVVDDVISTGGSAKAALALLRRAGAEPVAVASLVTEGSGWREVLGTDAGLVHALGAMPLFRRAEDGSFRAEWQGGDGPGL